MLSCFMLTLTAYVELCIIQPPHLAWAQVAGEKNSSQYCFTVGKLFIWWKKSFFLQNHLLLLKNRISNFCGGEKKSKLRRSYFKVTSASLTLTHHSCRGESRAKYVSFVLGLQINKVFWTFKALNWSMKMIYLPRDVSNLHKMAP